MLSRILQSLGIVRRRFGLRPVHFALLPLLFAHRALNVVGLALDPLLFRRLRAAKPRPPIFIIGNPRSGTTFLHRFLVARGFGAGFELWHLLWPSLTARTLIRPFLKHLERVNPARFHGTKAHPTSLRSVETDDALVFFRFLDGLFRYGYFLAWDDEDHAAGLEAALARDAGRDFGFLAEAQARNLVWHGADRAVGKVFSMALRPEAAIAAFPDAKFLYMLRDPVDTIPSGISLLTGVLEQAFPLDRVDPAVRARWNARLYEAFVRLYGAFAESWAAGRLPADRVMIVRYDRMMADLEGTMDAIAAFSGHPLDEPARAEIARTAEKQRRWSSEHAYDLARFGLDAERIRRDCAIVYSTFGLPMPGRAGVAP
jgi:hypothetical protein